MCFAPETGTFIANVRQVDDPPRYLSQSEAATYLRVSVRFMRTETRHGLFTPSKVGRKLLYEQVDLDRYVRDHRPA